MAAGGALGAHSFVAPGISIADLALALAAALAAFSLWTSRRAPALPRWFLWVGIMALWSLLGAAVLAPSSPFGFSAVEFAKSFAKLLFYPASFLLLAPIFDRLPRGRTADLLLWALTLNAALAIYVYAVMVGELDLPFHFLWALSGQGEEAARPFVDWGVLPAVRARGIASEPATLGWFQVLGLAAVLLPADRLQCRAPWRLVVVGASVVLTFSLTAYALLGMLFLALLWSRRERALSSLRLVVGSVALAAALLLALPVSRRTLDAMVFDRAVQIAAGAGDHSATLRLWSSWEMAAAMVRPSPVFGAGLGQYDVALETLRPRLSRAEILLPGTQGWNALAYLLGTLGPVGLACGLLLVWEIFRRSRPAAAMMLIAAFADSTILGAPFWLFYLLFYRAPEPVGESPDRDRVRRRAASAHSPVKATSAAATASQVSGGRR